MLDSLSTPNLPQPVVTSDIAIAVSKHTLNEWLSSSRFDWTNQFRYLLLDILPADHQNKLISTSPPTILWEHENLYQQNRQTHPDVFEAELTVNFDQVFLKGTQGFTTLTDKSIRVYLKWEFDRQNNSLRHGDITLHSPERQRLWEDEHAVDRAYTKYGIDDEAFGMSRLQTNLIEALAHANTKLGGQQLVPQQLKAALQRKQAPPSLNIKINPVVDAFELYNVLVPIRYHIAKMDRYKPFLDNPLWHPQQTGSGALYQSQASRMDTRYLMHCSSAYEAIYNFWSRIGELIAKNTYTGLGKIDFVTVVPILMQSAELSNLPPVQWFNTFTNDYYKPFISDRKQVVHHQSITTKTLTGHLSNAHDKEEIGRQQLWKESRLEYVVDHFNWAVEGANKLSELLRQLPTSAPSGEEDDAPQV